MAVPPMRFFHDGDYVDICDVRLILTVGYNPRGREPEFATKAVFSATTHEGELVLLEKKNGERVKEVPLDDTYFKHSFSTDLACALIQFATGRKVEHSYIPNDTLHESTHCFTVV
jgi:hypothetical protein